MAAYTIGRLVAGKVLAKVGTFALKAKCGKVIVLALVGAGTYVEMVYWQEKGRGRKQITFPEDPNKQV
ncbi:MAG: hypothetical protein V4714_22485 [Bacteroidota bacterium]